MYADIVTMSLPRLTENKCGHLFCYGIPFFLQIKPLGSCLCKTLKYLIYSQLVIGITFMTANTHKKDVVLLSASIFALTSAHLIFLLLAAIYTFILSTFFLFYKVSHVVSPANANTLYISVSLSLSISFQL